MMEFDIADWPDGVILASYWLYVNIQQIELML